ncbi:serine-rich adhesin for platelets-like [Hetaerina americana]|uniref:serine-rich adhesin for platelets-like n=1 Tax=Hetaerina americana TaxID=62018 RepID=UPI003A7F5450
MDVTESSQGSSKDDKEGEVSSTCNDNRNNEERASIEVASNSNNPTSLECSESSSGLEGTSTKRSLSPDTSNALGGLMEDRETFSHPPEAEQSGEGLGDHRGLLAMGLNDNLPSVSCDASTPESNQVSDRGNSEEMLTSTTEDSVMIAQALGDENITISESGEENRPSSAGQNNPQEDFISVSSASNAQNSDGAGNSNIPGMLDVEEELDAAVDGNVPSLPGAADSTTLELMELSDDSSSSVGENFGVSTTDREMWQVSTTQSYHSNLEMPSSECVPSARSQSPSASTSRETASNQPLQRECQQSDTVSATENGEGASVSTTNSDASKPATTRDRAARPPNRESNDQSSPPIQPELNDTVSASTAFPMGENRGTSRQMTNESASSCTEQEGPGNSSVVQEPARKNNDSVSSSKDCIPKAEEASGSQPSTSTNQESKIDTTTGNASKTHPSNPHRRNPEDQGSALSSFSITTSNRGRNSPGDSFNAPVSRGTEDTASTILRLIGLEDESAPCSRTQTDSRVSTSGQSSSKDGASSTTTSKAAVPRDVSSVGESISVRLAPDRESAPGITARPTMVKKVVHESKDSRVSTGSKSGSSALHIDSPSQSSSSSSEDKSSKVNIFIESPTDSGTPVPSSENTSGDTSGNLPSQCSTPSDSCKETILKTKKVNDIKNALVKIVKLPSSEEASPPPSCSNSDSPPFQSRVEQTSKDSSSSKLDIKVEKQPGVTVKGSGKSLDTSSTSKMSDQSNCSEVHKEFENSQVVSEVFVTEESEVEWSEEAVLIGEEVSMSAVEEALFSGKSEVDRFPSRESMDDSDSTSQTDMKDESGPLKRFGSSINIKTKKSCMEKEDSSDFPCHSSMRVMPPKLDSPSTSKKSQKPIQRDNLEAILSAMEGSSIDADMSSASCTPPMADPQNSNESGGDAMNMESIMADLLKSKMEAMDADSGSDDIQIIEVIEHPRKEKPVEPKENADEGIPMSERILVEIGEGGGIRVGPMQPSRGSIRSTRGLPGITVMRGGIRGRGRGSRSIMGSSGRGGNQVAMRRGVGRGGGRGSGTSRGRGNSGDATSPPCSRGLLSPRGMSLMGSRGMGMLTSPRGMCVGSPRGVSSIGSPRGGSSLGKR